MCHLLYVVGGRVTGVTYLDNIMYVVCVAVGSSTIRLYNTDTLSPLDVVVNVTGMKDPSDIVVCRHDRQLYVAEWDCIWRVSVDDHSYVKWMTMSSTDRFRVNTLSLTSRRLLVTSEWSRTLRQYNTVDSQLLHHIPLPQYVWELSHAVETTRQTFVVGHYGTSQNELQSAVSELLSVTAVNAFRLSNYIHVCMCCNNKSDITCALTYKKIHFNFCIYSSKKDAFLLRVS